MDSRAGPEFDRDASASFTGIRHPDGVQSPESISWLRVGICVPCAAFPPYNWRRWNAAVYQSPFHKRQRRMARHERSIHGESAGTGTADLRGIINSNLPHRELGTLRFIYCCTDFPM